MKRNKESNNWNRPKKKEKRKKKKEWKEKERNKNKPGRLSQIKRKTLRLRGKNNRSIC